MSAVLGFIFPFCSLPCEIQISIIKGNFDLSEVLNMPMASDLIERMVQMDSKKRYTRLLTIWTDFVRPEILSVKKHPFLWTPVEHIDFLLNLDKKIFEHKELRATLDSKTYGQTYRKWNEKIDRCILEAMTGELKTTTFSTLVRFIRNLEEHFPFSSTDVLQKMLSKEEYQALGKSPSLTQDKVKTMISKYFLHRFPSLILDAWNVVINNNVKI